MDSTIERQIIGQLAECTDPSHAQARAAQMTSYLLAVLEANETTNLTRVTDLDEAQRLHILDSLTALPEVNAAPAGSLCDMGSGGGFPGVPLAIATGRRTTLIDSVGKKARIVSEILASQGLDTLIDTSSQRIEEYALTHRGDYAVVVARALAPLPVLIELAAPLLCEGGALVALKSRPSQDELDSAAKASHVCGLRLTSSRAFRLVGTEQRVIFSYTRIGKASIRLPRKIGFAQKRPLW